MAEATPIKILACHNYYRQQGGEDLSFDGVVRLLRSRGHEVVLFTRHNDEIEHLAPWELGQQALWSRRTYTGLRAVIRREQPRLLYCCNTFPLLSPAAHSAGFDEGVPVVQSLESYRAMCNMAFFLRDGRVCRDCVNRWLAWPAVVHGCYHDRRLESAAAAAIQLFHRTLRRTRRRVTLYCTPSEFARREHELGGIPADAIMVRPNFVDPDPGPAAGGGNYAVFVGRLSPEKGIDILLEAWSRIGARLPLKIVGDGPLADRVHAATGRSIEWLGHRSPEQVLSIVGQAKVLVCPSVGYETFGRVVIEAFATGTPVIASRHSALAGLVQHGRTGYLFEPGSASELVACVDQVLGDPEATRMRIDARAEYERAYTGEANYRCLMSIFERALAGGRR